MEKNATVFVAGHNGLVGSALYRMLKAENHLVMTASRGELDLEDQGDVNGFFKSEKPDYVFLAAAKVAGIKGNMEMPGEMICKNLRIQTNVIEAARQNKVKKLMFFGSSCIYPKLCPQPMKEEHLLTGPLEPSNEFYAIAKIAGLKMCQAYRKQYGCNFISVMPTNLYGPRDNYALGGHVIPELIRRFYEAKVTGAATVKVWGDGTARREFLFSDDLALACLYAMNDYEDAAPINIGYGSDVSIRDLATAVARTVDLDLDRIVYDASGPVGTPVKLVDSSKIRALGWDPSVGLVEGLKIAYEDFLDQLSKV